MGHQVGGRGCPGQWGRCWEPCDVGDSAAWLAFRADPATSCALCLRVQLFLLGWVLTAKVISSLSPDLQTEAPRPSWKLELQA